MQKIIIRYSLLGFALWLSVFLGTFISMDRANPDFGFAEKIGYLAITGFVAFIIPAQLAYVKENKVISFGLLFKMGFFVTLIASVLVASGDTLYTHFFYPEFMDEYTQWNIKELKAANATDAQIEQFKADLAEVPQGPGFMFLIMFFTVLPIGTVINLISSTVINKLNSKA